MPLNNSQIAQLRNDPAGALAAAQQAEIAALAGGNVPVQLPGMTLADIENELRRRAQRAAEMGDRTIVATTESAIAMNRQILGATARGIADLQGQVDDLRNELTRKPKTIESKTSKTTKKPTKRSSR
jgi:hypothetical protein